ncbi:hypothetical protein PGB90_009507 [Kerria lacca]
MMGILFSYKDSKQVPQPLNVSTFSSRNSRCNNDRTFGPSGFKSLRNHSRSHTSQANPNGLLTKCFVNSSVANL